MGKKSKKAELLVAVYQACKSRNNMVFDNLFIDDINRARSLNVGNKFDVTKIDNSHVLPEELRNDDIFVVHLGGGRHQFVEGVKRGYHNFEKIINEEKINWPYRKSILNEVDTSESNIISVASNQRILHDFLYSDIVENPKAYNSRRTKFSSHYFIGQDNITIDKQQIEIDFSLELNSNVTFVEGKNGFSKDFAIYQLFLPQLYLSELNQRDSLGVDSINCCYLLRKRKGSISTIRCYLYRFTQYNKLDSIELIKKAEYRLAQR